MEATLESPEVKIVDLALTEDYLKRKLARSPFRAVTELIWNAVDADATSIWIKLLRNSLGGIDGFRIADNGSGFDSRTALKSFGNLGQSWKVDKRKTARNRPMHGKKGEGRLFVAALGGDVTWISRTNQLTGLKECQVVKKDIHRYAVYPDLPPVPRSIFESGNTGTVVQVEETSDIMHDLEPVDAIPGLLAIFAEYISAYALNIDYDGELLDLESLFAQKQTSKISVPQSYGNTAKLALTFLEWKDENYPRTIHYADENGINLATESLQRVKSPGLSFMVVAKAARLRQLSDENLLVTTCQDFYDINEAVIDAARGFATERLASRRREARKRWRESNVYPFEGEASNAVDDLGRKVFDACASAVESNLDNERQEQKNKKFVFRLLKVALDRDADATCRIVKEVLGLQRDDTERLVRLLDKTTFPAIIDCSNTVSQRLEFLVALKGLVFNESALKHIKEKEHLHKLLDKNCWLFGEQYQLAISEQDITEALLYNREVVEPEKRKRSRTEPKTETVTGRRQRIDMMLNKRVVLGPQKFEHLVIELKRPSNTLSSTELTQIENYALAVAKDPRFNSLEVKWNFWIPCVEHDEWVKEKKHQEHLPAGCVYAGKNGIRIWVKTWAEIIAESEYRLDFLKRKLDYDPGVKDAIQLLYEKHSDEIPPDVVRKIFPIDEI